MGEHSVQGAPSSSRVTGVVSSLRTESRTVVVNSSSVPATIEVSATSSSTECGAPATTSSLTVSEVNPPFVATASYEPGVRIAHSSMDTQVEDSGVTAIAYETVQLPNRSLPLLAPMSEVAGRLATIVGANTMLKPNGGPGLLVPGVPGTSPARVTVLGGGVAGTNAAAGVKVFITGRTTGTRRFTFRAAGA